MTAELHWATDGVSFEHWAAWSSLVAYLKSLRVVV